MDGDRWMYDHIHDIGKRLWQDHTEFWNNNKVDMLVGKPTILWLDCLVGWWLPSQRNHLCLTSWKLVLNYLIKRWLTIGESRQDSLQSRRDDSNIKISHTRYQNIILNFKQCHYIVRTIKSRTKSWTQCHCLVWFAPIM